MRHEMRKKDGSEQGFKRADWTENATFGFIRKSYLVAAKSLLFSVRDGGNDSGKGKKVDFVRKSNPTTKASTPPL